MLQYRERKNGSEGSRNDGRKEEEEGGRMKEEDRMTGQSKKPAEECGEETEEQQDVLGFLGFEGRTRQEPDILEYVGEPLS